MKSIAAFLALVTLTFLTVNLHADTISATVLAGGNTEIITPVLVGGAEVFNYTNLSTDGLDTSLETITATYADVSGLLGVLNVTEACATVTIIVHAEPCQALAFSFTDVTLPDVTAGLFVGLGANVNADVASVDVDGSIGLGSGSFNFTPPPSAVPEPGSLSLMATGLLGAAGVLRRKFSAVRS
jgi:hypothetical protein